MLRWLGLAGDEEYAEEIEEVVSEFDPDEFFHFSEEVFFEDDWMWILFFWALWEKMKQKNERWEVIENYKNMLEGEGVSLKRKPRRLWRV